MWLKFYMFRLHSHPLTNTAAVSKILFIFFFFFAICISEGTKFCDNSYSWESTKEDKLAMTYTYVSAPDCVGGGFWVCVGVSVCVYLCAWPDVSVSVSACCFVTKQKLSHKYFPSFWLEIYQRYPPHTRTHRRTQTELLYNYTHTYILVLYLRLHTQLWCKAKWKYLWSARWQFVACRCTSNEHSAAKTVKFSDSNLFIYLYFNNTQTLFLAVAVKLYT